MFLQENFGSNLSTISDNLELFSHFPHGKISGVMLCLRSALKIPLLEAVSRRLFIITAMSVQEKDDRSPSAATMREPHACRLRIQFIVLCFSLFLAGWNDGSTGPLLPRIQNVYHV